MDLEYDRQRSRYSAKDHPLQAFWEPQPMALDLRFAVASDLHIGLPHTIQDHPTRFHLVELSIPALEKVLGHLTQLNLNFLLIPGDLTQHGEPENHTWLAQRLAELPFPTYVIPGNHDVPVLKSDSTSIGWQDFPSYYRKFGYQESDRLFYSASPVPGVRIIALNSNCFNTEGKQIGHLDETQLHWLSRTLDQCADERVLVMIHHNILEHFPDQTHHPIGHRYILDNAAALLDILKAAKVQLIFTGHLHVQDIAHQSGIFDITTGSLVSYPHPYRVIHLTQDATGETRLEIKSHRVETLLDWPDLQHYSREWMGDRSVPFMTHMLTQAPLNLGHKEALRLAPSLKYFWTTIAAGDAELEYPELPEKVRQHFESYSHSQSQEIKLNLQDNQLNLQLHRN
jgi:3',5'-cyclic AMP phosphodiesterase CpdA